MEGIKGKSPLTSKTLWTNILALAAIAVQARYGYVVPPEAQVALLGIGNIGLRMVTGQPVDWSQVKLPEGPPSSRLPLVLLLLLPLLPTIGGCAAVKMIDERPVLSELTVRVATARVLEEHPTWAERARDLAALAIKALDESEQTDLAGIEAKVLQALPGTLTIEERELATVLIRAIRGEIEGALERQGVTEPDQVRMRVATVLGWIWQVADARAGQQGA